jgi:integrase
LAPPRAGIDAGQVPGVDTGTYFIFGAEFGFELGQLDASNLKKWLIPYQSDNDALLFPYSETVLRSWRRAIFKDLDVTYIQDGARHSFATYYLAQNSMDDTIQELGHTDTKMLFKHYRGLAKNRKRQASAYFKIAPMAKTG